MCLIVGRALWRAGKYETGWRFAPLRATGLVAGGVLRVGRFVASMVFAFFVAAVAGALRATF